MFAAHVFAELVSVVEAPAVTVPVATALTAPMVATSLASVPQATGRPATLRAVHAFVATSYTLKPTTVVPELKNHRLPLKTWNWVVLSNATPLAGVTVMIAFAPKVLEATAPSYPAPAPAMTRTRLPDKSRTIVRLVVIVVTDPAVAVWVKAPPIAPRPRYSPHAPAANVPVAPLLGNWHHASSLPSYIQIDEADATRKARAPFVMSNLSDTTNAPAAMATGALVQLSHALRCSSFLRFTMVGIAVSSR
jgi:hypothetical protein